MFDPAKNQVLAEIRCDCVLRAPNIWGFTVITYDSSYGICIIITISYISGVKNVLQSLLLAIMTVCNHCQFILIAKILIANCLTARILIAKSTIAKIQIAESNNCPNTDCRNTDCPNRDCPNTV